MVDWVRIVLPARIEPDWVTGRARHAVVHRLDGETMGTTWSVRLVAPAGEALTPVRSAIAARLDRVIGEMSNWEPESDISRFNRAPPGVWQAVSGDFAGVLGAGLEVARISGGAFDPAIGHAVDRWGFGPGGTAAMSVAAVAQGDRPRGGGRSPTAGPEAPWAAMDLVREHRPAERPAREEASLRGDREIGPGVGACPASGGRSDPGAGEPPAHSSPRDVWRVRRRADVALDFSGIAKGFAVDAVARMLTGMGFGAHLVEIGGELRGAGVRPDGQPWWVDIETPPGLALPPMRIALCGLSVATSGDYRRWRQQDGVRVAHSIDPRLGVPVSNCLASVTVLHAEAMMADAWATALLVAGLEEGMRLAREQELAALLVRREGDGARDYMSPALADLLV